MTIDSNNTPSADNAPVLNEETKMLLTAAGNAQSASRFVVVTSMILAFTFFVAAWNAYVSWDRFLILQWKHEGPVKDNEFVKELRAKHTALWIESRVLSFNPIGSHIGVHDIVPIVVLVMVTCAIWLFYSVQREFTILHQIGLLKLDPSARKLVYWDLVNQALFFSPGKLQSDVGSTPEAGSFMKFFGNFFDACHHCVMQYVPKLLCYTPCITLMLIWAGDIYSVFKEDVFSTSENSMWQDIWEHRYTLGIWMLLAYGLSLVGTLFCFQWCRRTYRIFDNCEKKLHEIKPKGLDEKGYNSALPTCG